MSEVDLSVSREAIAEAARRAVVFQSSPAMEAIAEAVRRAVVFQSSPAMEAIAEAARRAAGFASSWTQLAKAFERARRPLPPNLLGVKGLGVEDLQRLADEEITLWAVPRAAVATRLITAPTRSARRQVLGANWQVILDDCSDVAALVGSGHYAAHARYLEMAMAAMRDGHIAAGQALVANTLDTLLQASLDSSLRQRLTNHRDPNQRMNHFEDLDLRRAMVFRPIWHAYRPQTTPGERAVSASFARHAIAHRLSGRQINRRNAVQGAMLTASLLNFLVFWANG